MEQRMYRLKGRILFRGHPMDIEIEVCDFIAYDAVKRVEKLFNCEFETYRVERFKIYKPIHDPVREAERLVEFKLGEERFKQDLEYIRKKTLEGILNSIDEALK